MPNQQETLRRRRLQRGLAIEEAAAELGVPAKSLRAIEWDRRDLLGGPGEADRIERLYAAFLGLETGPPAPQAAEAPPPARRARRTGSVWLLAGLAPLLVVALVYGLGEVVADDSGGEGEGAVFGVALGLVLFSSLLLGVSVLPPGVVARTLMPSESFARYRQPLALAAIGILIPVVLFALLTALT